MEEFNFKKKELDADRIEVNVFKKGVPICRGTYDKRDGNINIDFEKDSSCKDLIKEAVKEE